MEGHFSTGQSPLWALVPMEEEAEELEEEEEEEEEEEIYIYIYYILAVFLISFQPYMFFFLLISPHTSSPFL